MVILIYLLHTMASTLAFRELSLVTLLALLSRGFAEQCFSDLEFNAFFAVDEPTCCQKDVCGLPCPAVHPKPFSGYAILLSLALMTFFVLGSLTIVFIEDTVFNFFVAGKSMPLWMLIFTLSAQAIDSSALLGNVTTSYRYHFFDGVVLPIGLGLSLILNGMFLARHVNNESNVLTLPDILSKRYGKITEVLVSICCIVSFMMLLAANLVGMGNILGYLFDISTSAGIWIAWIIVWAYTVSAGLISDAYTDVIQGVIGWPGCAILAYYMIANEEVKAPPPSIGFPGYIYPDTLGDGGICDTYQGIACTNDPGLCCYNEEFWCPSEDECRVDNGAYPFGDQKIFGDQMGNPSALSPFPNAIFWNWSTIFILGVGNMAALDFQARCIAAKDPSTARWGCIISGFVVFFVAIPFASLGSITRVYYGPDSIYAEFVADSCHGLLGLPTCGMWKPDPDAFMKMMTQYAPTYLGGWCLIGIVSASMSTADGAILAMATVFSNNLLRQLDTRFPNVVTADNLLKITRIATLPLSLSSVMIAAYYKSPGGTGYLLTVAFDIVLATVVVPLFGCFYAKNPRPNAAFLSIVCGASTRLIMEFVLPKDGFFVFPQDGPEFLNYGPAASTKFPTFIDRNETEVWNPETEPCDQAHYEDYSGVDSLSSFLVNLIVFVSVQTIENFSEKPLFTFPGMTGYTKSIDEYK